MTLDEFSSLVLAPTVDQLASEVAMDAVKQDWVAEASERKGIFAALRRWLRRR